MDSNSVQWITRQLKDFDWSLIKGSTLLSVGTAIARILGLAYSLVVAAAFPAQEYGEVRYAIAVASIVAIGTMPFGQHVIARFVSKNRTDEQKLDSVLSNGFFILPLIFVATLIVSIPILLALGKFNIGILAIFFGETLFYAYWGLSTGFLEARRLTAAYLGSNLVQIVLVYALIVMLGIRSSTLALLIYGLSYLPALALLMVFWPLPGHVRVSLINKTTIGELLRFALPIWVSHTCFTLSLSVHLLLLEQMRSETELGAYSLSKTLATMFLIVPMGISTLLMPKVAATPEREHRHTLVRMLLVTLLVDGLALAVYLPLARPLTQRIFGVDYLVPLGVSLLLSLYMIAYGIHGLVTAVFVGSGRPQLESVSRVVELAAVLLGCWFLIPWLGALGAAIAVLAGKLCALLTYGVMSLGRLTSTHGKPSTIFVDDVG